MINAPASESSDDDAVSTRLTGIEERLDEIIRQLDKMKHLVRMLDEAWSTLSPITDISKRDASAEEWRTGTSQRNDI